MHVCVCLGGGFKRGVGEWPHEDRVGEEDRVFGKQPSVQSFFLCNGIFELTMVQWCWKPLNMM